MDGACLTGDARFALGLAVGIVLTVTIMALVVLVSALAWGARSEEAQWSGEAAGAEAGEVAA